MANAVLTLSVGSVYDDLPELRYHFPRTYLNQIQAAEGLLRSDRKVLLPMAPEEHPHPAFLDWHRENVFKG